MTRAEPRTLADLEIGSSAVIAHGGTVSRPVRQRLAELGLRPGALARPLLRTVGGGRLVAVGQARVVVGRELLTRILVSVPAPDDPKVPVPDGSA
ncbi:MAG: FeoA family protein [Kineosporiaceae bacterium]|jgi:ferrous iron transport protein A